MQRIEALGIRTDSASVVECRTKKGVIFAFKQDVKLDRKADYTLLFTLQDVIDLIPKKLYVDGRDYNLEIDYYTNRMYYKRGGHFIHKDSCHEIGSELIDTAYELLCWVIEEKQNELTEQKTVFELLDNKHPNDWLKISTPDREVEIFDGALFWKIEKAAKEGMREIVSEIGNIVNLEKEDYL